MRILIITDDSKLYLITQQIISSADQLVACTTSEISAKLCTIKDIDIIVMDFSKKMIKGEKCRSLLEVKGKLQKQIPILVVLDEATVQDIFEVLQLGALDYIEKKNLEMEYEKKISYLRKWRWYFDKNRK